MSLVQMVYASRPFGFDTAILSQILHTARRRNAEDNITGALICRGDLFLQMLEGPAKRVEETYHRIRQDDRHLEVTSLMKRTISTRLFPEWAMRDDPVQSWMWSAEDVHKGAVTRATEQEVLSVFERVAATDQGGPRG